MTLPSQQKEKECAEKIVELTGYGGRLHVNDILPDIKELAEQVRQAERARVRALVPIERVYSGDSEFDGEIAGWNMARNAILAALDSESSERGV